MKLNENILALCKERGWSLSKLAREAGVPSSTLHHWSVGRRSVDLQQLRRVAGALQVSLHTLVFGEPDPHEKLGDELLEEIFKGDVRVTVQRIKRR